MNFFVYRVKNRTIGWHYFCNPSAVYRDDDMNTLGVFIGFNADNDKVFTGDIVENKWNERYLVQWNDEGQCVEVIVVDEHLECAESGCYWNTHKYPIDKGEFNVMLMDPYGDMPQWKVIGNVYENVEILNQCK